MRDGTITDPQISASSEWDSNHAAIYGRLTFKAVGLLETSGSWSAGINDRHQWLQIYLGSQYFIVTRLATQGRDDRFQWVTKFVLMYSTNGGYFLYYREQGQFDIKVK